MAKKTKSKPVKAAPKKSEPVKAAVHKESKPVSKTKIIKNEDEALELVTEFLNDVLPEGKHFNIEIFSNEDGSVTFHQRIS